ncbi:CDP-glycerol glycerophosphotransferase family protein, partial [Bacillus sp. JJ1474]
ICNKLNILLRNKLLQEDINEFFEIKSVLNNIKTVLKEFITISDFNEWKYVTNIVIGEIFKILFEEKEQQGDFVELNKIQHIIARLKTKFRKKIKVVFLVQLPSIWPSTESVWKSFCDDARCEVQIVQLPFYHHNYDQKQNESIGDYLDKKNISYKYWYDVNLENEKPDVVFFQNPYDSTRPVRYSFGEITKFVKRTVYIHYCLDILGGEVIDYHFKLPACTNSWKVFVRSERYKEMFKKYCPKGDNHVVVTGHPKMDMVYNLDNFIVESELEECIGNRKVILWNPHHMIKENEWSTFLEWQELLLTIFQERNDIFLIIRPHPLLLGNLEREFGGTEFVNLFLKKVNSLENVMLDLSDDYKQAFKVSAALISDASSLLLEYLPTRKPIMYLPKINGGGLNDDGDIIDYYYNGIEEKDIKNFIDLISNNQDPLYHKRISQINNYLYSFDGNAGYRIKENIISSLLDEDI